MGRVARLCDDNVCQHMGLKGFVYKAVHTSGQALLFDRRGGVCRTGDNAGLRPGARLATNLPRGFDAIHFGHFYIHEDDVIGLAVTRRQRRQPVVGRIGMSDPIGPGSALAADDWWDCRRPLACERLPLCYMWVGLGPCSGGSWEGIARQISVLGRWQRKGEGTARSHCACDTDRSAQLFHDPLDNRKAKAISPGARDAARAGKTPETTARIQLRSYRARCHEFKSGCATADHPRPRYPPPAQSAAAFRHT